MTKEKFLAYVAVQESGATNMFDAAMVCKLSGHKLTKEDCLDIMKNYSQYKKQYSN